MSDSFKVSDTTLHIAGIFKQRGYLRLYAAAEILYWPYNIFTNLNLLGHFQPTDFV